MITDINQLDPAGYYTYTDYLTWKFSERVELLKGKILRMSPAPSARHQTIVGNIYGAVWQYLKKKNCKVYVAPFDVRLPVSLKEGKTDTVVQPDITVICNLDLIEEQGCNGAPDLVVEVLSPGNTKKEMRHKFVLYEEAGIKEYWLVHPADENLIKFTLNEEGKYIGSSFFTTDDEVRTPLLPDFVLNLEDVFWG